MEMIIELCGMMTVLGIVAICGIGLRQEYLTSVYGEKIEDHVDYRRLTVASHIITGISLVTCVTYIIGLYI